MKKSLVAALLVAVLLCVAVAPAFAKVTDWYSACPNGKPLNVREYPSKEAKILAKIPYGEKVGVDHIVNGWAMIVWGSQDAWVQSSLLSKYYPGKKPVNPQVGSANYKSFKFTDYAATVKPARTTGTVTLYWNPSTDGTKLGVLHNGDEVTVLAQTSTWAQVYVEDENKCGFMLVKYLVKED
ncbi:MAG: SH3 domain-containing protein [Clostridia bacterium]|nr:SH3 domain-containing protein [Clostridia bacterium]